MTIFFSGSARGLPRLFKESSKGKHEDAMSHGDFELAILNLLTAPIASLSPVAPDRGRGEP